MALILACVGIFVWQLTLPIEDLERVIFAYGTIPAVVFTGAPAPYPDAGVPAWATVVTSMFLHGGIAHLLGNMLFLWIFGDNVEWSMGRFRFIVFYTLCGAAAATGQAIADPSSTTPMIGASGAISGVLGAYLVLFPFAQVRTLFVLIIFIQMIYVPAILVLGIWFGIQFLSGLAGGEEAGVAFWAHVGGFIAGVVLIPFFKRRTVRIFAPARHEAWRPAS
ncbi:MAG: rhomboid family intramembrane serine protease [Pseudomonadota bacterium]